MMQKSLPAACVGLRDESHRLSAGGCTRNEVMATGEAGATALGSRHHGCPIPGAPARVQIPGMVLERHKGAWELSKALAPMGFALYHWSMLQPC